MINKLLALSFVFCAGALIGSNSYANQSNTNQSGITAEVIKYQLCLQELLPRYSRCRASFCGPENVRTYCATQGGPLAIILGNDNSTGSSNESNHVSRAEDHDADNDNYANFEVEDNNMEEGSELIDQ